MKFALALLFALVLLLSGCLGQATESSTPSPSGGEQAVTVSQQPSSGLGVFEDDGEAPPAPPSRAATAPPARSGATALPAELPEAQEFAGLWRVFSSRIFYDIGGAGGMSGTTRTLELDAEGNWAFGSSRGKWRVSPIAEGDWARWGVSSYGPTRKIVLEQWAGAGADGPVEEEAGAVNFFWAVYRAEPPTVENAGRIQTRFDRASD